MGANNWAVCPRCLGRARAADAKQLAAVMDSYGKVPVREFDQARAAIVTPNPEDFRTFREDYEISGAEEGTIVVSYGGGCNVCGLSLTFTDEHPLPCEPEDTP